MSRTDTQENLIEAVAQLKLSWPHLEDSFKACAPLKGRHDLSRSELIEAEAFTSRFARTSDILVKQAFRALDAAELEDSGSIIDLLNRAHKRGLFDDEAVGRRMRAVRNEIAHEYRVKDFPKLLDDVLALAPAVLTMCERTLAYADKLIRS